MITGATQEEAEDATSKALLEMLRHWPVEHPVQYARKAAIHNFIKEKTGGKNPRMVANRMVERGHVLRREGVDDARLTDLEEREWSAGLISRLSPAQREVMQCLVDGLSIEETSLALCKSRAAVRRSLCDARGHLVKLLNADNDDRHQDSSMKRPSGRRTDEQHPL
jgi:DNA-directed RNA polymerase specialized sigma24 family protein